MDWNKGFSAAYYAAVVDPLTWRDTAKLQITDGNVSRSDEGLRGSADLGCVNYEQGTERWLRIWLNARQEDSTEHIALFTGLACSPERKINGELITNSVTLYSVLKPAEDVLLPLGWYAPKRTSGEVLIKTLLAVTPAPVVFEYGAPMIKEDIVAESGENHLTMADKILTAINWRIRITGDGTIHVLPKETASVAIYDAIDNDAVEPEIEVQHDWFDAPNVFRAVANESAETVYDTSVDSPLSITNRGREVWKEDSSCNLNDGESLYDYARRRLKEEQQTSIIAKYRRRYNPDIYPGDILRLNYPRQALTGSYLVTSQSMDLGYGCTTSEEVVRHGK